MEKNVAPQSGREESTGNGGFVAVWLSSCPISDAGQQTLAEFGSVPEANMCPVEIISR